MDNTGIASMCDDKQNFWTWSRTEMPRLSSIANKGSSHYKEGGGRIIVWEYLPEESFPFAHEGLLITATLPSTSASRRKWRRHKIRI